MSNDEIKKAFNKLFAKLLNVKYELRITQKEFLALNTVLTTIENQSKEIERFKSDLNLSKADIVKQFANELIDKIDYGVITHSSDIADFAAEFLEQDIYNPMRCCECKHYLPINDRGLSGICCKTHISFGEPDERIDEHVHYCALAERKDIDDT